MPVGAGKSWSCRSELFLARVGVRQNGDMEGIDRVREYVQETGGSCTELLGITIYHSTIHNNATGQMQVPNRGKNNKNKLYIHNGTLLSHNKA